MRDKEKEDEEEEGKKDQVCRLGSLFALFATSKCKATMRKWRSLL
jgi:hypothetical protein